MCLTTRPALQLIVVGALATGVAPAAAQQRHPIDAKTDATCISTRQVSKEQPAQPGKWQHSVYVANRCAQPIRLKVCFAFTTQCIVFSSPPKQETLHELGVKDKPDFQYTVVLQ